MPEMDQQNGNLCELEWTHLQRNDEEETEFQDGFSDDYIFEADKIYPVSKELVKNSRWDSHAYGCVQQF